MIYLLEAVEILHLPLDLSDVSSHGELQVDNTNLKNCPIRKTFRFLNWELKAITAAIRLMILRFWRVTLPTLLMEWEVMSIEDFRLTTQVLKIFRSLNWGPGDSTVVHSVYNPALLACWTPHSTDGMRNHVSCPSGISDGRRKSWKLSDSQIEGLEIALRSFSALLADR